MPVTDMSIHIDSPPRYAEEGPLVSVPSLALSPLSLSRKGVRRAGVTVVAAAATLAVAAGPVAAAPTPSDRLAGRTAAGWLNRQFVDGTHLQTDFGGTAYDDPGLTLDAVLAFAAAKTNKVTSDRAMSWIAQPATLGAYVGTGGESYAGAHAKLALAIDVTGRDVRSFGGRNIIAELAALQTSSGRLSDKSEWGDYSNAFGQSFGVLALQRAGLSGRAGWAAGYLQRQSCADGSVPIAFDQSPCAGDPDATALAIQAFAATGRSGAAARAGAWLAQYVKSPGVTNSNTAGLVAAGLDRTAYGAAADTARRVVRSNQLGCAAPFSRRAAIAFTRPFDAAAAPRATAQAILGLAGAYLATLSAKGSIAYAPTMAC